MRQRRVITRFAILGLTAAAVLVAPAHTATAAPARCGHYELNAHYRLFATQLPHHRGGLVHGIGTWTAYSAACAPQAGRVYLTLQVFIARPFFAWVQAANPKHLNIGGWDTGETHTITLHANCASSNRRWRLKVHYTAGISGTGYGGVHTRAYNGYWPKRRGRRLDCRSTR